LMRRMISAGPPVKRPPHTEFAETAASALVGFSALVTGGHPAGRRR